MKLLLISILFLTTLFAQELSKDQLTPEENLQVSDNMLEIQNLQLQLQGVQIRLQQVQANYNNLEAELAIKYDKVGCTLSLKRDWICPSAITEKIGN